MLQLVKSPKNLLPASSKLGCKKDCVNVLGEGRKSAISPRLSDMATFSRDILTRRLVIMQFGKPAPLHQANTLITPGVSQPLKRQRFISRSKCRTALKFWKDTGLGHNPAESALRGGIRACITHG